MSQIKKIKECHLKEAEQLAEEMVMENYLFAKQSLGMVPETSSANMEKYRQVLKEEIKTALAIEIGLDEAENEELDEPDDIKERMKRYDKTLKEATSKKEKKKDQQLINFSLMAGSGVAAMMLENNPKLDEAMPNPVISLPKDLSESLAKEKIYIQKLLDKIEENDLPRNDEAILYIKYKTSKLRYQLWKEQDLKKYSDLKLQVNSFTVHNLEIENKEGAGLGANGQKPSIEEVQWEDVVGQEEAKKMLRDTVVRFLATYNKETKKSIFEDLLGTKPPKAVLLYGPPGTGKTMCMKAAITEAEKISGTKTSYNIISAADIKNKYVGESAKSIKKVFDDAKKTAPSLLIIDEIDALFSKRRDNGFNEGEREICSVMMQELDGIMKSEGYIVVGITNLPKALDKAITSRFASRIEYTNPKDAAEVTELFKVHMKVLIANKAVPEFTDAEWKKIGEIGYKNTFTGRLVKQFSEKLERERNDLLTEWYKSNEKLMDKYGKDPEEIRKKLEDSGKRLACSNLCKKMEEFAEAMHGAEDYNGVEG